MGKNIRKHTVVPNTQENVKKCLCPGCPAHNECMKDRGEFFFCSKGYTRCKIEKRGCLCLKCPVGKEYKLISVYFCEKGAATHRQSLLKK